MKFCLGAVQLGLNYGISNINGKPDLEEAVAMLKQAYENGVRYIDTAHEYGNSEEVIGSYHRLYPSCRFNVITKMQISESSEINIEKEIVRGVEESLNKLNLESLDGLLLHTPSDYYKKNVMNCLMKLKSQKKVRNIGVSIYNVFDALIVASDEHIDYIQVPYNLLDRRLDDTPFWQEVKKNDIKVFARSIYLQGLLLMQVQKIPSKLHGVKEKLIALDEIIDEFDITRKEAAWMYVKSRKEIDFIVVGAETMTQLNENIDLFDKAVNEMTVSRIKKDIKSTNELIVSPNLWN